MNSTVRQQPRSVRLAGGERDVRLPASAALGAGEPVFASEAEAHIIGRVIGSLSKGLENLSCEVLLRLQNARNAALARRRT